MIEVYFFSNFLNSLTTTSSSSSPSQALYYNKGAYLLMGYFGVAESLEEISGIGLKPKKNTWFSSIFPLNDSGRKK